MKKRSTKQNYSLPEMNGKDYSLEMGKFTPSKPIIGGRPQLSCLFEFLLAIALQSSRTELFITTSPSMKET